MKRFMMLAALFGAMTLGACVDNQESQSVTDIRDAKTEELKSLAALNNAQAEATKVLANAEAALKNAEAAYQNAMAEQVEAKTALLEVEKQLAQIKVQLAQVELESAQVELERQQAELLAEKAEYEQRIAVAQAQIAKTQAELEVYLALQESALLKAQLQVFNNSKNLETALKVDYLAIYNTYAEAVKALNDIRAELVETQAMYVAVENGLVDDQEAAVEAIKAQQEDIAEAQEWIAYFQSKIALFEEFVTLTDAELETKLEEAYAKFDGILTDYTLADLAYNRYCEANPEPEMPEAVEEYMLKMFAFINDPENCPISYGTEYWNPVAGINMPEIRYNSEIHALGYDVVEDHTCESKFVALVEFTLGQYDWDANDTLPYTKTSVEHENGEWYTTYAPSKAWTINEKNFDDYLKTWGKKLEKNNDTEAIEALKKTLKETVEAAEAKDGVYARHAAALEAYNKVPETQAAAKKAADEAKAAADKAVADAKAVKDAEKDVIAEEDALHKATSAANAKMKEAQAAWEKAVAELSKDDKNEKLVKAAAEAYAKYEAAKTAYEAAVAEWKAGQKKLENYGEVIAAAEKAATEAAAKAAEAAEAATEAALAKIETDAKDALDALCAEKEATENKIARLEAQIAAGGNNPYNIEDYETAVAWYESLKEGAAIAADEKTYEEINAYWPAHFESEEYIAYEAACEAYYELWAEIEALKEAYAADDDYEYYVNICNEEIAALEAEIEEAEAIIAEIEETIANGEGETAEILANLEDVIEMLELKVAAAQKEVDEAKAKLDAVLE